MVMLFQSLKMIEKLSVLHTWQGIPMHYGLCEGGELLDKILSRGGRYIEEDAKLIVVQILSVVAFCHLQGVVHRDLKPENFLFTSRNEDADMRLIDFGLSDFIRPDYLKDDCLKINCTVGVVVSAIDCPRLHSIQVPDSDIGAHFGTLLENIDGSDVIFNVAGEKFNAHKLVLAARSPVFWSELIDGLEGDTQEVAITDMEPEVFKAMLHFIYRDALVEEEWVASSSSLTSSISDTLTAKFSHSGWHKRMTRTPSDSNPMKAVGAKVIVLKQGMGMRNKQRLTRSLPSPQRTTFM